MVRLDYCREIAFEADSVGTHHEIDGFATFVLDLRSHRFAVLRPELEDVRHLDCLVDRERLLALGTTFAVLHFSQVEPSLYVDVAVNVDATKMEAIFVRTRHHVFATPKRFIRDHEELSATDGTEATGQSA